MPDKRFMNMCSSYAAVMPDLAALALMGMGMYIHSDSATSVVAFLGVPFCLRLMENGIDRLRFAGSLLDLR